MIDLPKPPVMVINYFEPQTCSHMAFSGPTIEIAGVNVQFAWIFRCERGSRYRFVYDHVATCREGGYYKLPSLETVKGDWVLLGNVFGSDRQIWRNQSTGERRETFRNGDDLP